MQEVQDQIEIVQEEEQLEIVELSLTISSESVVELATLQSILSTQEEKTGPAAPFFLRWSYFDVARQRPLLRARPTRRILP